MIPKIIHQTWKTAQVPQRYAAFAESWRLLHPGWEYRLWTDDDLAAFVASEHPAFLPIYNRYPNPISRVDAARYLVLRRFGGLYVDLDFEALRPIEPLLDGCSLAIGLEPDAHVALDKAKVRGMTRILCPSLIASEPGHPFWDHVRAHLIAASEAKDVLDATGPFLLTRALDDFAAPDTVRVLAARDVYPVDKERCWDGSLFHPSSWDDALKDATAHHHWDGTWWRSDIDHTRLPRALWELPELMRPELCDSPAKLDEPPPLVSAMMVTRDRPAKARFAIDCFRRQIYPNKELVIVDDGGDDTLAREVAELGDPRIRMVRRPDRGELLGVLRNVAVDEARGPYVCQWDDDDLCHPFRLAVQMMAIRRTGAQAAMLTRWMLWWVAANRFAVGEKRLWEGSLVVRKDVLPRYPNKWIDEDQDVIKVLRTQVCIAGIDQPRLYVYIVHGTNTWFARHFEPFWHRAGRTFEGDRAARLHRELARDLPLDAYERSL
jgi:hypothetical protein